jgi:hypothetical protein
LFVSLVWLLAAGDGYAQKRKTAPKTAKPKPKPAVVEEPAPPPVNLAAEAALVAEQIKLVTRFTFVYGKVANSLEVAADEEKKGQASPAVIEQTRKGREAINANFANLAAGLDKVVARFQSNPRLQVQYLKLSYAAEALGNARNLAATGQLNEAGKALVLTVERLTDVMLALR